MTDLLNSVKAAFADQYRVEVEVGRGGMATVYLAEDLKHRRKVAVKVLQPEIAAALGQDRFLQEIETVARLHHPHILALYDSGEADGFLYYVMPLVEGESLRDRLNREKQLPLDDALHIAREVADALSYAHSHDVVHRDIKPENIMLEAGHAVVTDFGIATAITESGGDRLTETGIALGTPIYMSPEQAAGSSDIDGRSDLYSLGCVLYEMLAGQAPFTGPTVESVVHQHLVVEPPSVTSIRPAIPIEVAGAIQRALSKTPADRFSPAAQFAEALIPSNAPTVARSPQRRIPVGFLAIALIAILVLATALIWRSTAGPPTIVPAELQQVTFNGTVTEAVISPDGQFLAFLTSVEGRNVLSVQDLEGGRPIELYADSSFTCCPQWSPDGSQLLFQAGARGSGNKVIVPRLGGNPRPVVAEVVAVWSSDGSQLASWWPQAQRIWLTDVASGDTTGSIPMAVEHDWVNGLDWTPNDDALAIITFTAGRYTLWRTNLDGSDPRVVLEDTVTIMSPTFSRDGSAIYFMRTADAGLNELWKVRVSSDGEARDNAERVMSSMAAGIRHGSVPAYSLSSDGSKLLYARVASHSNLWLYEIGQRETLEPALAHQLTFGTATRETPRLSPDGSQVVFLEATGGGRNLHTISVTGDNARQLTFMDALVWSPAWSPDGRQIAFGSMREGVPAIWVVDADGGTPQEYGSVRFESGNILAWSPAQSITYQLPGDQNFMTLDLQTLEEQTLVDGNTDGWLYDPRPAPNQRRIAFHWTRSGDSTGTWILSSDQPAQQFVKAGFFPIGWSADGASLYAMEQANRRDKSREVYRIPLNTRTPELLTTLPAPVMPWDVSITPDGRLIVTAVEERQSDAWVVQNFDPSR